MRYKVASLLAAAFSFAAVQAASAADMPTKAPVYKAAPIAVYNWTGFYVGGNVGWASNKANVSTTVDPASNMNATAQTAIINGSAGSLKGNGFTGGLQLGYNQQISPNWLVGVEADFNWLGVKASRDTGNFVEPVSGITVRSIDEVKNNWLATLRARAGMIAAERWLVYATGGLAVTQVNASSNFSWSFADGCPILNTLNNCHVGSASSTRVGYAVGGGVEYAISGPWSLKAEYIYAGGFGSMTYRTTNAGIGPSQTADHHVSSMSVQTARIGLNFKFGG
jgi:outer membrane immunogenic protein